MLRRLGSAVLRTPARLGLRRDRLGRVAHVALLVAGLGFGLALALVLPGGDVERRCPPRGEGYELCFVQKSVLPTVLLLLGGLLLGHLLARGLLVRLPAWRRRVREVGERREGGEETRAEPPYRSDPFLLASTWGAKEGRTDRRRPRLAAVRGRLRRR